MSRIDPQVNFRMPAELKQKLEAAAARNKRSTTAEISARLEETFHIEEAISVIAPGAPLTGTADLLRDIDRELDEAHGQAHDMNLSLNAQAMHDQLAYTTAKLETIESQVSEMAELLKRAIPILLTSK